MCSKTLSFSFVLGTLKDTEKLEQGYGQQSYLHHGDTLSSDTQEFIGAWRLALQALFKEGAEDIG